MASRKSTELSNHPVVVTIAVVASIVGIISSCVAVYSFLSGNTSVSRTSGSPTPTRLAQDLSDMPSGSMVVTTPRIPTPPSPMIAVASATPELTLAPTPTASVLNLEQAWIQDGVALALKEPDIRPDKVTASFILKNKTNGQIMFNFGSDSFSVRDNLGNDGRIRVPNRYVCPTGTCYSIPQEIITPNPCEPPPGHKNAMWNLPTGCPRSTPIPILYPGTGDTILKAGESLKIDMEFSGFDLMKMEITEVIVTVKELSRVKDVSWRIAISH